MADKKLIEDIAKDVVNKVNIAADSKPSETVVPINNNVSPEVTQSKLEPVAVLEKKVGLVTKVLAKNAERVKTSQIDISKLTKDILGLTSRLEAAENKIAKLEKKASLTSKDVIKSNYVKPEPADRTATVMPEVKQTKPPSLVSKIISNTVSKIKGVQGEKSSASKDSIAETLTVLATSLKEINQTLSQVLGKKQAAKISGKKDKDEKGAAPVKEEKKEGFFDLLKSLFMNPAVVAALAGIVYTILPKEWQDRLKALFSGFNEGLNEALGESEESGFKGFSTAVKTAGIAIATIFGAKVIGGLVSAITTAVKIVRMIGAGGKAIGKLGKAKGALVAGAVATGAAVALSGDDEEKQDAPKGEAAPKSETPEAEKKPAPSGTGIKPSAGPTGIKPSAKGTGIKVPEMSGEDKPVMEMIKRHEGVRTRPYKDSLGLWTVGVGHLIGDGKTLPPEYNREFSMQEVDSLFAKDYQHHKEAAQKIPGYDKLNNTGKAALVDLTFNMGPAWYKKWPNFTKALKEGDTERAAASLEDSKWYGQVGNRARTIVAMMKAGAGDQPGTLTDSSGQPVTTGFGEPVQTGSTSSGAQVAAASQSVKQGQEPKSQTQVANINASSQKEIGSTQDKPREPIPSPIASRGSLGGYVRHSTHYA